MSFENVPEGISIIDLNERNREEAVKRRSQNLSLYLDCIYHRTLRNYLTDELTRNIDYGVLSRVKISEITYFFIAANFMFGAEQIDDGRKNNPISILQRLRLLVEFSIKDRQYSSRIIYPGNSGGTIDRESINSIIIQLINDYNRVGRDVKESVIRERLRVLSSEDTGSEETDAYSGNQTPLELLELLVPLTSHLNQSYLIDQNMTKSIDLTFPHEVNSFNRSLIRNWKKLLEINYLYKTVLNCYPYLEFDSPNRTDLVLACMTPLDESFVDERVGPDHRIGDISLAVFDIADFTDLSQLSEFRALLRLTAARLNNTVMAYRYKQALEEAGGESSKISRYWYSKGVVDLLKAEEDRGALEKFDTLDFWEKFVRDLLCARIEGVKNSQSYPFDRAYLFRMTGAGDLSNVNYVRLRVLEAALRSKDPKDQNAYCTSMERGDRSLKMFRVADKIIQYKYDLYVRNVEGKLKLENDEETARQFESVPFKHYAPGEFAENEYSVDKKLSAILCSLFEDEEHLRLDKSEIWKDFSEMGLSFEYRHGLDLSTENKSLYELQRAYLEHLKIDLAEEVSGRSESADEMNKLVEIYENKKRLSKVIYISYDPILHPEARDKEGKLIISENERFTLILVADDDEEKSISELDSERQTLQLLIELIVRQKLRDKKKEQSAIKDRMNLISGAMDQFLHRINNEKKIPAETKLLTEELWRGLRPVLEQKTESTRKPRKFIASSNAIMGHLLKIDGRTFEGDEDKPAITEKMITEALKRRAEEIKRSDGKLNRDIFVNYIPSSVPKIIVDFPEALVRETFDVMFKNAVEAAGATAAPSPRQVLVQIQTRPREAFNAMDSKWILDFIIENSTKPVPADRMTALNQDEPKLLERNKDKTSSTGVGVFAARMQLKSGLSHGSDIRYFMLSEERIQGKLSLPARAVFTRIRAAASEESLKEEVSDPYVLYVEDEEDNYKDSLEYLRSRPALQGVSIIHRRGFLDAEKDLQKCMPRLMIADMTILRDSLSSEPDRKYGINLLESFFRNVCNGDRKPPLWLVTSYGIDQVKSTLENNAYFIPSGYKVVKEELRDLCDEATVCIFSSGKKLNEVRTICEGLDQLSELIERKGYAVSEETEPARRYKAEKVSFDAEDFDDRLQRYFEKNSGSDELDVLFLSKAEASSKEELASVICRWFSHEGIPDLEEPRDKKRLNNTTMHKTILLNIEVSADLLSGLHPKFLFWCLNNNIAFRVKEKPDRLAAEWATLIKDSSGIFSVIRHNLRGKCPENRELEIRREVDNCDEVLLQSKSCIEKMRRISFSDEKENSAGLIEQMMSSPEEVKEARKKTKRGFDKVKGELKALMEESEAEIAYQVEHMVQALENVSNFLLISEVS